MSTLKPGGDIPSDTLPYPPNHLRVWFYKQHLIVRDMDHFDVLCKVLERMDPATYNDIITEKSLDIVAALTAITEDGMDGMSIYMDFILCAISADGRLAEEEYMLIAPSLAALFGRDISYDGALALFREMGLEDPEEYKRSVDLMVDILGLLSQELKDDIILVCMMVCAVDGVISDSEREWIAQLIE